MYTTGSADANSSDACTLYPLHRVFSRSVKETIEVLAGMVLSSLKSLRWTTYIGTLLFENTLSLSSSGTTVS